MSSNSSTSSARPFIPVATSSHQESALRRRARDAWEDAQSAAGAVLHHAANNLDVVDFNPERKTTTPATRAMIGLFFGAQALAAGAVGIGSGAVAAGAGAASAVSFGAGALSAMMFNPIGAAFFGTASAAAAMVGATAGVASAASGTYATVTGVVAGHEGVHAMATAYRNGNLKDLPKQIVAEFNGGPGSSAYPSSSPYYGYPGASTAAPAKVAPAPSVVSAAAKRRVAELSQLEQPFTLPLRPAAPGDSGIPEARNADLVLTPSTRDNLTALSSAWLLGRPALLEGPTGAGKTALVRYLAWKTQTPYRRINLSYYTDIEDLIGRYVGAEKRFSASDLAAMSDEQLVRLGADYDIAPSAERSHDEWVDVLLNAQTRPRWVNGPLINAMLRGEVVVLDEVNLARAAVLEALNSLFDDDNNVVLTAHKNEIIRPHRDFRIFATMNPGTYAGRENLSEAMRSRWNALQVRDLDANDVRCILEDKYLGSIPQGELAKLAATHVALCAAAGDGLARKAGGVAYTVRNLHRVAQRFLHFRGSLPDAELLARETQEVYLGGLFDPEDKARAADILAITMPEAKQDFYKALTVRDTPNGLCIGDVTVSNLVPNAPDVGAAATPLVLTQRTARVLYWLAKAVEMGENVALVGESASGKTAVARLFAQLRNQRCHRQQFSAGSDSAQIIGAYNHAGWQDGLLLTASRPEGNGAVFLADELNLANPAILERLNSVLDDERKLVLAEKEGEEVLLHPHFCFIAAMNPPTKQYTGRHKLSVAMQNRFTMLHVPPTSERAELLEIMNALATGSGMPSWMTGALVDIHMWTAKAYSANGEFGISLRDTERPAVSLRQLLNAWNALRKYVDEPSVLKSLAAVPGYTDKKLHEYALLLAVKTHYAGLRGAVNHDVIVGKAADVIAERV